MQRFVFSLVALAACNARTQPEIPAGPDGGVDAALGDATPLADPFTAL
jgi:hypothetical protein